MFHIVLHQPEIPPNTGNVLRLAANCGAQLHLVKPLGFRLDNASLRRAGLDYAALTQVTVHDDWAACRTALQRLGSTRQFALTTGGTRRYDQPQFMTQDTFVFGAESCGLPAHVMACFAPELRLYLPMAAGNRSLNLSNSVAVVVYEAWRQLGFVAASR